MGIKNKGILSLTLLLFGFAPAIAEAPVYSHLNIDGYSLGMNKKAVVARDRQLTLKPAGARETGFTTNGDYLELHDGSLRLVEGKTLQDGQTKLLYRNEPMEAATALLGPPEIITNSSGTVFRFKSGELYIVVSPDSSGKRVRSISIRQGWQ